MHGTFHDLPYGIGAYICFPFYMHRFPESPEWVWHWPRAYYRPISRPRKDGVVFALYAGIRHDIWQKELTP